VLDADADRTVLELRLAHIPEKWTPISGLPGIGALSAQKRKYPTWLSEKGTRQRIKLERIPISSKRDAL
jgi:hypothetical protein